MIQKLIEESLMTLVKEDVEQTQPLNAKELSLEIIKSIKGKKRKERSNESTIYKGVEQYLIGEWSASEKQN